MKTQREAGSALVELAALSTVLVLLVAGSIDYGSYAYDGILLGNAAQAGVQFGSHDAISANNFAGMQAAATNDAVGITLTSATATSFCTCSDGTTTGTTTPCTTTTCTAGLHRRQFVQVVTTGSYNRLMIFPGIASPLSISRTAALEVSP